jgi:hypothetical protein
VAANVAAIVLDQLAEARRRDEDFGSVWPSAVEVALGTVELDYERKAWAVAFSATVDSWHAAWERSPAPDRERATTLLREDRVPMLGRSLLAAITRSPTIAVRAQATARRRAIGRAESNEHAIARRSVTSADSRACESLHGRCGAFS